jgi:hypothetical protein
MNSVSSFKANLRMFQTEQRTLGCLLDISA